MNTGLPPDTALDRDIRFIGENAEFRTDPVLQALAPYEEIQVWAAAGVLFREDEPPAGAFVLLSGEVDLTFSSRTGRARTLRVAVAGQILGLSAIIGERHHDYTATAHSAAVTGYVTREKLSGILDRNPRLWFSVLQMLSGDLQSCYDRMRALTHPHTRER